MSGKWPLLYYYFLYSPAFSLSPRMTSPMVTAASALRHARLAAWCRVESRVLARVAREVTEVVGLPARLENGVVGGPGGANVNKGRGAL